MVSSEQPYMLYVVSTLAALADDAALPEPLNSRACPDECARTLGGRYKA